MLRPYHGIRPKRRDLHEPVPEQYHSIFEAGSGGVESPGIDTAADQLWFDQQLSRHICESKGLDNPFGQDRPFVQLQFETIRILVGDKYGISEYHSLVFSPWKQRRLHEQCENGSYKPRLHPYA